MDVRIRERLVGALVLVALIVLLVPSLLKGPGTTSDEPPVADTKSVEILLGAAEPAEGERLVPEPEVAPIKSDRPARAVPQAAKPAPLAADTAKAPPESARKPRVTESAKPETVQQSAWAVQLGAFSSRSKADRLVTDLRSRGYAAFVLEYRAGGQLLHRVRVGPEQDRARAAAIAERLRKDGFQTVVAPHP